jgi:ribosome biogenesis ATPase
MFACDEELKENIFPRIYYVLSPKQFLSNGKTPPRGFLLHGPPGCGKTQLVYAISGVNLFVKKHLLFMQII